MLVDPTNITAPAPSEDPASRAAEVPVVPALVQVWSAEDQDRLGAVALVHDATRPELVEFLLGRAGATPGDAAPRLAHVRQVPGANVDLGPLTA